MKIGINRRTFLTGSSACVLAACTNPPPHPVFPQITFTHLPAIRLDARSLEIVDASVSPGRADVSAGMPVPPSIAARQWANDRLVPVGNSGSIVFTITEASVVETKLERTSGVRGVVTRDQSERYDGKLAARVAIRDAAGGRSGTVSAEATRSRTVAENISLNERDKVWFEITEAMINDLNRELEKVINQFLQPFLIR